MQHIKNARKPKIPYMIINVALLAIIIVLLVVAFANMNSLNAKINSLQSNITLLASQPTSTGSANGTSLLLIKSYNITGSMIMPNTSLPGFPIITANSSFGQRLTNINKPLNSSYLSVINNAPDSYFETAGLMLLNGSINNDVGVTPTKVNPFILNGKPTVIYLGSITCVFCGENRWAMALALGRFGNFSNLFEGYSSFGDHDLPTLYWSPSHYTTSAEDLGNFYNSKYLNFISIDDALPITGGFQLNSPSLIQQRINATNNVPYKDAFEFIVKLNNFQGTPYTIWGKFNVPGADAVDFGNSTPTTQNLTLTYMTHKDVFNSLSRPSDQFAWTEYAAADVYIAMACSSINNSAPICTLPAIQQLEVKGGY